MDISAKNRIHVEQGDITKFKGDALVNAANSSLLGGGGVDGAIHRAAGPDLVQECRLLGGCKTGQAKLTKGYRLPARYVIHTVGPVWRGGSNNEAQLLASCYRTSLELAAQHHIKTIAFPAISCGIYRYPVSEAAKIAVTTVVAFLEEQQLPEHVTLICYEEKVYQAYLDTFSHLFV
jgi:O-acetyl-ADP-ribose deacetylase